MKAMAKYCKLTFCLRLNRSSLAVSVVCPVLVVMSFGHDGVGIGGENEGFELNENLESNSVLRAS